MKIAAATLRRFTAVHTWTGLVAGFALFVAFYAGAITVAREEVVRWHASASPDRVQTLDDAQRLLDAVLRLHAEAHRHVGLLFPGVELPTAVAYWQDGAGTWQYATSDDPYGSPRRPLTALTDLVDALHYSLGLPGVGIYLMGVASLLYGVALFSGVVIHLPKLVEDLFALRAGANLKRLWQDAHNVIGVLGLPMHLMFATTGALLCLMFVFAAALDPLVFGGRLMQALPGALDTAPARAPAERAAAPAPLALWHARAIEAARRRGVAGFEPAYLKLDHAGDANGVVEITGRAAGALGAQGSVALDAASGALLAVQLPGSRDANHAAFAAAYALHFGDYGGDAVRVLYVLLGLAGAFLFYSGNLLWIESRRKRRRLRQGRAQVGMARATVGVCIGFCVAISTTFVAAQTFAAFAPARAESGLRLACFAVWAAAIAWAAVRPPARGARELLWAAALATAAVPLAHGLVSAWWPWRSAAAGRWAPFAVDVGALALASAFAALARASARRARDGDPHSVWADPARRDAAPDVPPAL
ncbi:MAG TPA: PepSY-associated TM helix domain-containing protein [Dokdonella sp.]